MATVTPPVRNDISGTAPNPSNAVARTAFGVLHDYLMNLLGTVGTPAAARAALDIKQLQSVDYSLAGNALTLKLNPTNIDFRSTSLISGAPINVSNAAQLTTTISSGSTAGTVSAIQSDIILLAINAAGTMELAWTNLAGGTNLDETGLINTTAEGGAGAADSATAIYSTTARTGVAYRVVGLFRSTQTTAGTWAQTPSLVQGIGGQALNTTRGPAFSAYASTGTSLSGAVATKIAFQVEEFDTASAFDSVTNQRFQPAVAGYYQINAFLRVPVFSTSSNEIWIALYKNGSEFKRGADINGISMTSFAAPLLSTMVYLNGTTDYVEIYSYQNTGGTVTSSTGNSLAYFQGFLARSA